MGSKKSSPDTMDPMAQLTMGKQLMNQEAKMNRVNTFTPYGAQTYVKNKNGTWSSFMTPTEGMKNLIGRQYEMAGMAPEQISPDAGLQQMLQQAYAGLGATKAPGQMMTNQPLGSVAMPANPMEINVDATKQMITKNGKKVDPTDLKV